LNHIIGDMPQEVVRRAINAQYADCEVTRYRVLALSWELERLERWKTFHTHSLKHLEEWNKVSLETLDFWRSWCRAEGVDVQPQEEATTRNLLEHEFFMLEHLQRHFRSSEKTAASHGVIEPEGIIRASTKGSSDTDDSDDSNLGISVHELQVPDTSDLESHTNSNDSDSEVSGSELEIPNTSDPVISYASDPEQENSSSHVE